MPFGRKRALRRGRARPELKLRQFLTPDHAKCPGALLGTKPHRLPVMLAADQTFSRTGEAEDGPIEMRAERKIVAA